MAEPTDTATKLLTDNRTVVCGKDSAGARIVVLPTLPDGQNFWPEIPAGTPAAGTVVLATPTVPAHISSTDVTQVTVKVDFATTLPGGSSKYVRRQFFKSTVGGPSDGKWCYTNIKGQPLAADGTVTTVALAADAKTTALTAQGLAVGNYAQPGPAPGTYTVTERQQGYSRYIGWTAQKG
jgi:hypothetical protein